MSEEDTVSWQTRFKRASERHADLYYQKAAQSYSFQKNEWTNINAVLYEHDNLRKAADYFESTEKPTQVQVILRVGMELSLYKGEMLVREVEETIIEPTTQAQAKYWELHAELSNKLDQILNQAGVASARVRQARIDMEQLLKGGSHLGIDEDKPTNSSHEKSG